MAMTPAEIAEERRRGRYAAAAALASGLAIAAGLVWSQIANRDAPEDNSPALLRFFDRNVFELVTIAVVQAAGFALLAVVAAHLYRATSARRSELRRAVLAVGVAGPLALALSTLVRALVLAFLSADYAGRRFQTVAAADDLLDSPLLFAAGALGFLGLFGLLTWFIVGSLNAMRAGLLSRFMGVLGILIGPAFVFGLAQVVLPLWLLALAALFAGRWPGGLPPAWEVGEAVPWPGRQEPGPKGR